MNFRQPTIQELGDLPKEERVTPFSNGTEAMVWYDNNCQQCKRSWFPKELGQWPKEETLREYMNIGKYCPIQYFIDCGFGFGYIPKDAAIVAGYTEAKGFPNDCMMFTDDDNDKFHYPKKPKPSPIGQLDLFTQPKNELELV